MSETPSTRVEYGDFQTPLELAREVCAIVRGTGIEPASVLEPTCGRGAFLLAALEAFPRASKFLGLERNRKHVQAAGARVPDRDAQRVEVRESDFFTTDWAAVMASLTEPILIIGNPPWVTNAALGSLRSANVPTKSNIDGLRGIDALTGRSNFDISEWMLRQSLDWLAQRCGMLAMLCKTSVARKVLTFAWSHDFPVQSASIYRLDAKSHFGASVDACLLLLRIQRGCCSKECADYTSLRAILPRTTFGLRANQLVADIGLYERWSHLFAPGLGGWRSGIKHDCSKVFELEARANTFSNGLGEDLKIEEDAVFPLMKSSDLAAKRKPRKWLLVPQRSMDESPADLERRAPAAWNYLTNHRALLERRASAIYRNRPPHSIFGVGPYSFAPWKVAISGLYKKLEFVPMGPLGGKPVMLDDTCYFFACKSGDECRLLHELVSSDAAQEFWSALLFWDSKRPITAQLLNSLDLAALARSNGIRSDVVRALAERQLVPYSQGAVQSLLFQESSSPGDVG